jgi:hypothetical protein
MTMLVFMVLVDKSPFVFNNDYACRCMNFWNPLRRCFPPLFIRVLLLCASPIDNIRSTTRCIDTGYALHYISTMAMFIAIIILYYYATFLVPTFLYATARLHPAESSCGTL